MVYVVAIVGFCVSSLKDPASKLTTVDFVLAIFPPVACVLGVLGFWFLYEQAGLANAYTVIWALGLFGCLWELRDLKKIYPEQGITGVILGLILLLLIFGPGLSAGAMWLRHSLR